MSQLQKHSNTNKLYITSANALTKDKAVTSVSVTIDTALWSTTKKNIIIKALTSGVSSCGYATGELVRHLSQLIDAEVPHINTWHQTIPTTCVNPDMLDELIAYTSAWLRVTPQKNHRGVWAINTFFRAVAAGEYPGFIPLPRSLTKDEQREFIEKYLRSKTDVQNEATQYLIDMIRNGKQITVNYRSENQ